MRTNKTLSAALLGLALTLSVASHSVAAEVTSPTIALDAAMQDYESSRWNQAFEKLAMLADAGNADAARIAVLMSRNGQALYKQQFAVEGSRLKAWLDLASSSLATNKQAPRS